MGHSLTHPAQAEISSAVPSQHGALASMFISGFLPRLLMAVFISVKEPSRGSFLPVKWGLRGNPILPLLLLPFVSAITQPGTRTALQRTHWPQRVLFSTVRKWCLRVLKACTSASNHSHVNRQSCHRRQAVPSPPPSRHPMSHPVAPILTPGLNEEWRGQLGSEDSDVMSRGVRC